VAGVFGGTSQAGQRIHGKWMRSILTGEIQEPLPTLGGFVILRSSLEQGRGLGEHGDRRVTVAEPPREIGNLAHVGQGLVRAPDAHEHLRQAAEVVGQAKRVA
jgi:hypothetical protein